MSTFSMDAYNNLRKCQTHLDETKGIMKRFPTLVADLAQTTSIPKLTAAAGQVETVCETVNKQLESLSETYVTVERDYREIGKLTGALVE